MFGNVKSGIRPLTSEWVRVVLAARVQLWFKGVPQLLEIRIELIKIVRDLEQRVSFVKGVSQP